MSGFKGTPGPWHYEGAEDGGRVLAMDDRQTIVHRPPCNPYNEQVRAEARLIAAAPDLLALAERVSRLNPNAGEIGAGMLAQLVDEAQRIVAKATGEQP